MSVAGLASVPAAMQGRRPAEEANAQVEDARSHSMREILWACVLTLAGCLAGPAAPTDGAANATHPAMPGVEVMVLGSANEEEVHIEMWAWNNGTATWDIAQGCDSPWGMRFEGTGRAYSRHQCLTASPPRPWGPGETSHHRVTVLRDEYGWVDQDATFTVAFNGGPSVVLRLRFP